MEEVKVASLDYLIKPNHEDDAQFFIKEEEENPTESEPLNELLEPPTPTIELKPLHSGLRYAFLNNGQDSPVIIVIEPPNLYKIKYGCPRLTR